jgi:plasmid stabilization system protein ParE
MPFKVEVADIVLFQAEEVLEYYFRISPGLALAFENELEWLFLKLSRSPQHYYNLQDGIHRRVSFDKFPYFLLYAIEQERVIIKMLYPHKGDPGGIEKFLR